ncbi:MAG TPA: hypothetical protein VJ875_00120 [Pyrinomonadaceae bacterium]|nr:hypothetical protein [Pyrinomonadaceae bacterium]
MQRGVISFVHVTSGKSLGRILEEGIKPYNPIFKEGVQPANSTYNQKRAHFTIQYPHPRINKESPVAILISPQLADREDASFTVTTSARKGVTVCIGKREIEQLFAEHIALPSRIHRLVRHPESPMDMPTSQMAEVRFSNVVSPTDFIKIVFPTLSAVLDYENKYGRLPSNSFWDVDERFFAYSPTLCGNDYYEWFRKFDDKKRIVLVDWYRRIYGSK